MRGQVFVSPRSASPGCVATSGSVWPFHRPTLSQGCGTFIDELNGTHLSTDTDLLLHAEDSNDEIEVDSTLTTTEEPHHEAKETFASFGVHADIVSSLAEAGIIHPFPIQAMTLPIALAGHDIIGQAKTGTGKTLGFGVPALQRVVGPKDAGYEKLAVPGAPQAMVIVPTRELAVQVASDLTTASKHRGVRIATIYGGRAYEPQIDSLQKGVELVVGTPGRLIDLYKQKHLNLKNVRIVILDEADEMLDLGFLPDVETLIAGTPAVRQTLLFSATMPGPVVAMARRYMTQPTHIRAADPDDEGLTKRDIRQLIYRAHNLDKTEVVARILQAKGRGRTIIFTKTKRTAAKVAEELVDRGFAAAAIHGDLGQGAREQALRAFRNNKVDVLVATDVAARGIDVDDVTHVINYQCVEDEKIYLHRLGRTGRAGNKGTAVTFVDWDDMPRWGLINKALGLSVPEPIETYSSSPHLYTDLDIPEGTKGRLPRDKRTHAGIDAEVLEDLGETGKRNSPKSGGRDDRREGGRGGRSGERGGSARSGSERAGSERSGSERSGEKRDAGRSRRRPSSDAAPSTEAPANAPSDDGGSADNAAARPRRNRSRTRRRNGEVVAKPEAAAGE
jgi:superfamily II DNA/RNA helicase